MQAMVNVALFEWVVENLLKNALDALQGRGAIIVQLSVDDRWICIDVRDTGKGMPKANFKRIFQPGFTTKTRGWGLGLSLSKRIIEEYHHGRIFVLDSEIDQGTTMRIMVRRLLRGFFTGWKKKSGRQNAQQKMRFHAPAGGLWRGAASTT